MRCRQLRNGDDGAQIDLELGGLGEQDRLHQLMAHALPPQLSFEGLRPRPLVCHGVMEAAAADGVDDVHPAYVDSAHVNDVLVDDDVDRLIRHW